MDLLLACGRHMDFRLVNQKGVDRFQAESLAAGFELPGQVLRAQQMNALQLLPCSKPAPGDLGFEPGIEIGWRPFGKREKSTLGDDEHLLARNTRGEGASQSLADRPRGASVAIV